MSQNDYKFVLGRMESLARQYRMENFELKQQKEKLIMCLKTIRNETVEEFIQWRVNDCLNQLYGDNQQRVRRVDREK